MRYLVRFFSVFILASISLSPARAATVIFDDWSVTCEGDGYCRAETIDTTDRSTPKNILRIARVAEPSAAWEISVETLAKTPPLLGPAVFRIAGQRPFSLDPNESYTIVDAPNEFFLTAASSNQALFRRMIDSRRVFVTLAQRTQDEVKASFSLIGLGAALLWIDEQQNRVGSRRMVNLPVAREAAVETVAPTPPPTSQTAEALAYGVHDLSFRQEECDVTAGEAYAIGVLTAPLSQTQTLVQIPCAASADNTFFAFYLVDEQKAEASLLRWAILSKDKGWIVSKTLSNARFDEQSGELSMIRNFGAEGDCGTFGIWRWQTDRFAMKAFRSKVECDGLQEEWPLVFP